MDYDKVIQEKYEQIKALVKEITDLRRRELEQRTGFKAGDLVQDDKGVKGVLDFADDDWGWNWHRLKKDGTPSANVCYVRDIDRCKKVQQ